MISKEHATRRSCRCLDTCVRALYLRILLYTEYVCCLLIFTHPTLLPLFLVPLVEIYKNKPIENQHIIIIVLVLKIQRCVIKICTTSGKNFEVPCNFPKKKCLFLETNFSRLPIFKSPRKCRGLLHARTHYINIIFYVKICSKLKIHRHYLIF